MMKKVMLVDDNHLSVEGLSVNINWTALQSEVVQKQYDGYSALKVMNTEQIDLILSDIDMPGMNGLELSKEILGKYPFTKIILISAYDEFEYAQQAVRIGAFDYIEKPIDYAYLTEVIQKALSLIDQEINNMELLEKSRPLMTANFFHKLLHSGSEEARYNLSTYPNYLNLRLDCHYYAAITFEITNSTAIKTQIGMKEYHIFMLTLTDQLTDLSSDFRFSYILNDLNGLICLLGHNYSKMNDFQKQIYKITDFIEEDYRNKILQLNIGIGTIVNYLWNLSSSYNSAIHALEYRFFFPQKNIFDARDIANQTHSLHLFEDNKEEQLIQLICKKDRTGITLWVAQFSENLLEDYKTKDLIFVRIYSILGRLLKFLYEMGIHHSDMETEIASVYSNLQIITNGPTFIKWFSQVCLKTCDVLESSVKTYHEQLCEAVLSYIREHYSNSALCLNEIAEDVNISPAHLSALYKKSSGINLSDIITSVRIDAACQLLKNTSLSLKEISERIGYTNQYYFSSCFKKKMGVNPSTYRSGLVQ